MTPEQAVKIAKWLGCEFEDTILQRFWMPIGMLDKGREIYGKSSFIEWLSSAEGERAIGNKVREVGYYLSSWAGDDEEDGAWASVTLTSPDRTKHIDRSEDTYIKTLHNAVLELIELNEMKLSKEKEITK